MNNNLNEQLEYISKIKLMKDHGKLDSISTYKVVTFGCQMNAKDSEKIEGILEQCGFTEIDDENVADIVLFNTCTVRENANQRLYGRIGQLKNAALANKNKIIGICGCMMQESDEVELIKTKYPYIKLIFGTHNIYQFPELLYKVLNENKKIYYVKDSAIDIVENLPTKNKYSFKCGINIMFGCNNFCTYCIVPYVRGRERSRNSQDIINEIIQQVEKGVVEVMLLGQNVNSYANDINNDDNIKTFPELLSEVSKIDGLKRIRFMTSHPKDLSDELIEVIKNNDKICNHIHLPLQSGSDNILKQMNRKYTKKQYLELVDKIKNQIEDVSITTDIIVGFPGETEEDFEETLDVIKYCKFNAVYSFQYSKRTGTKAATMDNQIDQKTMTDRFDRLLETIKIESEFSANKYVGRIFDCLIEDIEEDKNLLVGRLGTNYLVYINADKKLLGNIVNVKITKSHGFYFDGEIV